MVKYFCDICGTEVPDQSATFWSVEKNEDGTPAPRPAKQFCEACASKVEEFITVNGQNADA